MHNVDVSAGRLLVAFVIAILVGIIGRKIFPFKKNIFLFIISLIIIYFLVFYLSGFVSFS